MTDERIETILEVIKTCREELPKEDITSHTTGYKAALDWVAGIIEEVYEKPEVYKKRRA